MSKILFFLVCVQMCLFCEQLTWTTPPITLSAMGVDASDPRIGIDGNGNGLALWVENGFLKSSTQLVNMTWSAPATLSNAGASSPALAVDPMGNATALWVESETIVSATLPFRGTWSNGVVLSNAGASSPQIAVDSAGNVVAVWTLGGNIESATKLLSGNWPTNPDIISSITAELPQVKIGGNGNVAAVWQSDNTIFSTHKLIDGSWSLAESISDVNSPSINAQIAVDENGNAVALWYTYSLTNAVYSNVAVQSASLPFNGSWTSSVNVSSPGIYNPAKLIAQIAFDGSGDAIALWNTSFDGSTFNIQSSILPQGTTQWTMPVDIVAMNLYAYDLNLDVNAKEDAVVTYMYFDPLSTSIFIQSTQLDINANTPNRWSTPQNLSVKILNAAPRIASSLSGNTIYAIAAWVSFDGTNTSIQTVSGSAQILLPPTSLSVAQGVNAFGVFNEYYNTFSWQPSPSPNIVGYLVFRNKILINKVDPTVLQIVDHNQAQNGSVTYGVAAYDGVFQSTTATAGYPAQRFYSDLK